MKKMLTFLGIFMLLTSFAFASSQGESGTEGSAPVELELTKAYFFDSGDNITNPDLKQEYIDWFSEYFNVDLKVNAYPRPEYMQKYQLAMSSGEIKGLGWIFGGSYKEDYMNDGATLDLLPYVENNPVWQKFPKAMQEANVRDGKLTALPTGWSPSNWFARSIRLDWLDNLGMDKPKTIEEFYDVVKAFTLDDPDGNGENDTIGMTAAGVWNIQDIFHTFNVHTNHVGGHCITPSPQDGMAYVDGFLKPEMEDCLAWLADVYANGYLDAEIWTNGGSQMRERMFSGLYGTTYYWMHYAFSFQNQVVKVDPNANVGVIVGMTSKFADKWTNLIGGTAPGTPWVLIRGTENPQEQVDAFYNYYYGDEVGHFSGRYGVYDKMWTFGPNKEVTRLWKEKKEDGTYAYYPGPGIVADVVPLGLTLFDYGYALQDNPEGGANWMRTTAQKNAWLEEGLSTNLLYEQQEIEHQPIGSETYRNIVADIERIFVEAVTQATVGQLTPKEAIESYRTQMKALGAQKVLEEANAYLGRTTPAGMVY